MGALDFIRTALTPNPVQASAVPAETGPPAGPYVVAKGSVPPYQDASGGDRTFDKIDPALLHAVVKEADKHGYSREMAVALWGAETTFSKPGIGNKSGPVNPLQKTWRDKQEVKARLAASPATAQLESTVAELKSQGMPAETAQKLQKTMSDRQIAPTIAVEAAFDTLDEKRNFLANKTKGGVTPERLAWLYQGNGVINRAEAPTGRAYGKPVRQTTPSGDHPQIVRRIMTELQKPDHPLGNYIRSIPAETTRPELQVMAQ